MHRGYKTIKDMIRLCPLSLVSLTGKELAFADSFLPVDTGVEIECSTINTSPQQLAQKLRNCGCKEAKCDSGEVRFRLPKGVAGMITLHRVCDVLKQECALNPSSGIHYHVDCTSWWSKMRLNNLAYVPSQFIVKHNDFILSCLKSWNYTGSFNAWVCSDSKTAVKFHYGYKTIEFRIGEMSFDYSLLIKRIIHCQSIVEKLRVDAIGKNH